MKNNQDVVDFLNDLAINGSDTNEGVCWLLQDEFDIELSLPQYVYKSWEHFSGSESYPIRSTDCDLLYGDAFDLLPKWKGEYGKLRRDWCRHLAEYFAQ